MKLNRTRLIVNGIYWLVVGIVFLIVDRHEMPNMTFNLCYDLVCMTIGIVCIIIYHVTYEDNQCITQNNN